MEIENSFEKLARRLAQLPQKAPKPLYRHTCKHCKAEFTSDVPKQSCCPNGCQPRRKPTPHAHHVSHAAYLAYLQSEDWRRKAEKAKKRAGHRCQVCNRGTDQVLQLEAHHRTYEYLGDERPMDITVLCNECHDLFSKHGKLARP